MGIHCSDKNPGIRSVPYYLAVLLAHIYPLPVRAAFCRFQHTYIALSADGFCLSVFLFFSLTNTSSKTGATKRNRERVAESVLSQPEYRGCRGENSREAARCVLLDLSRGGRIKFIFIRYDENQRNVVCKESLKSCLEVKLIRNNTCGTDAMSRKSEL